MLSRVQKPLRRAVLGHRRLLAFALTAAAVFLAVRTVAPPPPPTTAVAVAARDLRAGTTLKPRDITTLQVPRGTVPDGMVRQPRGRTLASGVRRGEPITDARLVGPRLARDGITALPVRLPDAAMAALLRPGDHVDLYATDPSEGGTSAVARGVLVLAVPPKNDAGNAVTGSLGGRLVLVGVPPGAVSEVTNASVRMFLTVAFGD